MARGATLSPRVRYTEIGNIVPTPVFTYGESFSAIVRREEEKDRERKKRKRERERDRVER